VHFPCGTIRQSMNRVFAPDETLFERRWPPTWRWPTDFRKFMFWVFGLTSLGCIALILYTIPHPHKIPLIRSLLTGSIFLVHMAAMSGMAAWTIWNEKSWARGWAIAASLMYILTFLPQFIVPVRPSWDHHLVGLFIGLFGLVSFVWPDKPVNSLGSRSADS
jgi:hypothetical protein